MLKKKNVYVFFLIFIAIRLSGATHRLIVCFPRAPGGPDKHVREPNTGGIKI